MVRISKRSVHNKISVQCAGYTLNFRNFYFLFPAHIRKYRRQCPCNGSFSRPRWPYKQNIMHTCCRNLRSFFCLYLPLYVTKIIAGRFFFIAFYDGRQTFFYISLVRKKNHQFIKILYSYNIYPFNQLTFTDIFFRNKTLFNSIFQCMKNYRQYSIYGNNLSIKAQFSYKHFVFHIHIHNV